MDSVSYEEMMSWPVVGEMRPPSDGETGGWLRELLLRRELMAPLEEE